MAKRRSTARNRSHDASRLNHDVLLLVMMKLGVTDFSAFSKVCKSWRSVALSNMKRIMASKPPMLMRISNGAFKKECYCCLEEIEGRKFKTIIPHSGAWRRCLGLTCGYLIFFGKTTGDFWLVNPITMHQLHFPTFPCFVDVDKIKAILVCSPSIPGMVLVVINRFCSKIWFSIAGKGTWNKVSCVDYFLDVHAFKGKIYTLNFAGRLYEMSLNPNPKLTILEIKNYEKRHIYDQQFVSSSENLYVRDNSYPPQILYEIDFGEMKGVSPDEKRTGGCAFFFSEWKHCAAIKRESCGVDPRSKYKSYDCFRGTTDETRKGRFFKANMWYFPHSCLDVDLSYE